MIRQSSRPLKLGQSAGCSCPAADLCGRDQLPASPAGRDLQSESRILATDCRSGASTLLRSRHLRPARPSQRRRGRPEPARTAGIHGPQGTPLRCQLCRTAGQVHAHGPALRVGASKTPGISAALPYSERHEHRGPERPAHGNTAGLGPGLRPLERWRSSRSSILPRARRWRTGRLIVPRCPRRLQPIGRRRQLGWAGGLRLWRRAAWSAHGCAGQPALA